MLNILPCQGLLKNVCDVTEAKSNFKLTNLRNSIKTMKGFCNVIPSFGIPLQRPGSFLNKQTK